MNMGSTQHIGDVHDLPDLTGYMVKNIHFPEEHISLISLYASLGNNQIFRQVYVCLGSARLAEATLVCAPDFPVLGLVAVRRNVQKLIAGNVISASNEFELTFQSDEKVSYIFDRGFYFISDRPLLRP